MENTYAHTKQIPEFINKQMDKGGLKNLLSQIYLEYGGAKTAELANTLKNLGYKYALLSKVLTHPDYFFCEDLHNILTNYERQIFFQYLKHTLLTFLP